MAVTELTEPTAEQQQLANYNQNIGGALNRRIQYSVPADVAWCVVGCVFADVVTPADVTTTLVPAIEALTEVTSVNGDQFFGQVPSSITASGHEAVLHVSSAMSSTIGSGGDTFPQMIKNSETQKPPLDKKFGVFVLRVPAAMDATKITALETAMVGITGINAAEHLIDGVTSSRQSGDATLQIWSHLRINPEEV